MTGNADRLPTWDFMLGKALEELTASREKLGNARDWLNSDWKPNGGPRSESAGTDRRELQERLSSLKADIDQAKKHLYAMMDREETARRA
jgi:hypothetical protein